MNASVGQDEADTLSAKLQAFYDALTDREQAMLASILERTNESEVSGYAFAGAPQVFVQLNVLTSSRDAASGMATGRRQHETIKFWV